jgi:hypothetical protein
MDVSGYRERYHRRFPATLALGLASRAAITPISVLAEYERRH